MARDGTAVHLTTNPGLEDVVLDELGVDGLCAPEGRAGHVHVRLEGDRAAIRRRVLALRSVHRVVLPLRTLSLGDDPLGAIEAAVAALVPSIPELSDPATSFRVTSKRTGDHGFTSEDVQRVAGAGVRSVAPHPVRLKDFEVELRCDVVHGECTIGVQWTGRSHAHRRLGPYAQKTSLRSNVAWALCRLARLDGPAERVLDPFVGAGTILQEAGASWPDAQLAGGDRDEAAVAGTIANLDAAGLGGRSTIRHADALELARHWPAGHFDTLVTNPPFGRRLGRELDLEGFYGAFLRSADAVCSADARMALLVHRRGAFNRALGRSERWTTRHVRIVELGGLYVGLFVLGRPAGSQSS